MNYLLLRRVLELMTSGAACASLERVLSTAEPLDADTILEGIIEVLDAHEQQQASVDRAEPANLSAAGNALRKVMHEEIAGTSYAWLREAQSKCHGSTPPTYDDLLRAIEALVDEFEARRERDVHDQLEELFEAGRDGFRGGEDAAADEFAQELDVILQRNGVPDCGLDPATTPTEDDGWARAADRLRRVDRLLADLAALNAPPAPHDGPRPSRFDRCLADDDPVDSPKDAVGSHGSCPCGPPLPHAVLEGAHHGE